MYKVELLTFNFDPRKVGSMRLVNSNNYGCKSKSVFDPIANRYEYDHLIQ